MRLLRRSDGGPSNGAPQGGVLEAEALGPRQRAGERPAGEPEPGSCLGLESLGPPALLGLWHVQAGSLRRHIDHAVTPTLLHQQVTTDVHRAAQLIDTGLRTFAAPRDGPPAAGTPPPWGR